MQLSLKINDDLIKNQTKVEVRTRRVITILVFYLVFKNLFQFITFLAFDLSRSRFLESSVFCKVVCVC